ncbi:MAG: hydroxyacid dehydrogenase [Spartobacteria bacterium]|nr:hydroxyacid dehydrogenase [Spartobacteria bacterium]
MPDVIFYEAFEEESAAIRAQVADQFEAVYTYKTIQEEGDTIPPAPIISIRTQSDLPLAWGGDVALLSRSAGYDHLTAYRAAAGRPDIPCGYLPLYCARAVAEQAMLHWMGLLRKLPKQIAQFNTFHRDGITGSECMEKILLVVGVGNIGYEIVCLGMALGMFVWGVDLVERYEDVEYVDIDEGLAQADIIVCAMNLTERNRAYFNYERLSRAKPSAIFVNIARGEMSPPGDLLRLLEENRLGGVGIDVYDRENEFAVILRENRSCEDSGFVAVRTLSKRLDTIFTPHNAFNTVEAVERKAAQSVEQILHFMRDGAFKWPVPD